MFDGRTAKNRITAARKLLVIIKDLGKVISNILGADQNLKWERPNKRRRFAGRKNTWGIQSVIEESYFHFILAVFSLFTVIFTSCQTEFSADPCRVRAGLRRESLLAVQVCIESRWLKLLLEWFMSAQTLRGQSKHKATPSNLLHPVLQHSCLNGSGLRWMTVKRALAELFAQPYIDVKHMQGVVPDFISLEHLRDKKAALSTFINKTPQKDGISHGGALTHLSRHKKKKKSQSWRVCVRKERNKAVLVAFGNPTPLWNIVFLFSFTGWV